MTEKLFFQRKEDSRIYSFSYTAPGRKFDPAPLKTVLKSVVFRECDKWSAPSFAAANLRGLEFKYLRAWNCQSPRKNMLFFEENLFGIILRITEGQFDGDYEKVKNLDFDGFKTSFFENYNCVPVEIRRECGTFAGCPSLEADFVVREEAEDYQLTLLNFSKGTRFYRIEYHAAQACYEWGLYALTMLKETAHFQKTYNLLDGELREGPLRLRAPSDWEKDPAQEFAAYFTPKGYCKFYLHEVGENEDIEALTWYMEQALVNKSAIILHHASTDLNGLYASKITYKRRGGESSIFFHTMYLVKSRDGSRLAECEHECLEEDYETEQKLFEKVMRTITIDR